MTAVVIIGGYLLLLLFLGVLSNRVFRRTATDYYLASRGIGPFLLLMSLFGTTMTAFALVGSTGESFRSGIGVYGKLASSSGIVHSLCFFVIGIKLWDLGRRHGYVTQIQYFRDRFQSEGLALVLFPVLVGLVIPYLLVGVLSAGTVIKSITIGAFPQTFPASEGGIPFAIGAGVICLVVLIYVFFGGVRGTAWANAFQTLVFVILGVITFAVISDKFGGVRNATQMVLERQPTKLQRAVHPEDQARHEAAVEAELAYRAALAAWESDPSGPRPEPAYEASNLKPPVGISPLAFFSYMLIPLSVGMFPHVFQHWLTARRAESFKLAVVAHPLLIMIVWFPCVLIGTWATSAVVNGELVVPADFSNPNAVLAYLVNQLTGPVLGGLLSAGILAAIMSSLDSQFLCIGSLFANDIVAHYAGESRFNDHQRVLLGRGFVVAVVLVTYLLAVNLQGTRGVFTLGIWCFSGFSSLVPLVVAALYWKRVTKAGAYASVIVTAVVWVALFAASDFGKISGYLFLGMMPVVTMMIAATAALIGVSLVTPPPPAATLDKFFPARGPGARAVSTLTG